MTLRKTSLSERMAALLPRNQYRFNQYSVEVKKHNGRELTTNETEFVSNVQRLELGGVAAVLYKYADDIERLKLVKIAMKFHIYRNDFEPFLLNNKTNPKIKAALKAWQKVKTEAV